MLISRSDISTLKRLSTLEELVPVEEIPASFKTEFNSFFFGKTLVREKNKLFAYPSDIKIWIRTLFAIDKD